MVIRLYVYVDPHHVKTWIVFSIYDLMIGTFVTCYFNQMCSPDTTMFLANIEEVTEPGKACGRIRMNDLTQKE